MNKSQIKSSGTKSLGTKSSLGQFFTTNYDYILKNFDILKYHQGPEKIRIIEPFCGNGDLLNFQNIINNDDIYEIECYDIDPKISYLKNNENPIPIIEQDTLKTPPDYTDKFIITNPPYLARNKAKDKELFDKYNVNDLYKCFIKNIIENQCLGGIVIIPLNFWSSIRKSDCLLRKDFLKVYEIVHLNIFEEQVFDDTSYTVCSFQFKLRENFENTPINITIYPSGDNINAILCDENDYLIGGEIYKLPKKSIYEVYRATSKNKDRLNTNLLIKCIDDNLENKIKLSLVEDKKLYIDETPNLSSRTYASLIIEPEISIERQEQLVYQFNTFLEQLREKYHSLFLTNYRESKDLARKRISFELVYDIIIYILENT
jgi:hypothetical protein